MRGSEGGGGDGSERGVEEEERLQAAWDDTRQATTGLGDGDAAEADVWRRQRRHRAAAHATLW